MGIFNFESDNEFTGLLLIDSISGQLFDINQAACEILGCRRDVALEMQTSTLLQILGLETATGSVTKIRSGAHDSIIPSLIFINHSLIELAIESLVPAQPGYCLVKFNRKGIAKFFLPPSIEDIRTPAAFEFAALTRISDGIISVDSRGCCDFANSAAAKFIACAPNPINGQTIQTLFPGLLAAALSKAASECLSTGQSQSVDHYHPGIDIWIQFSLYPAARSLTILMRETCRNSPIQQELAKSNERFHLIAQATQDAVWEWEIATGASSHNEAFLQLFTEEVNGITRRVTPTPSLWVNKIHPEDRDRVLQSLRLATNAADIAHWHEEFRFLKPDGSYGVFADKGFIIRNAAQKAVSMIGSMADITIRREAEEALRQSGDKYRMLFDEAVDAIGVFCVKTQRLIEVNRKALELSGYSREELLSLDISTIVFSGDLLTNPFRFPDTQTPMITNERRWKRKDGSSVDVENFLKLLPGGNFLGFSRDITERKKAERKLADSENRLRTILNTEPETFTLIDESGHLLEINPAALAIIEADTEEHAIGMALTKIIHPEYHTAFNSLLRELFSNDEAGKLEFKIRGLKGKERWLEMHAVALKNAAGSIISALALSRDITARKQSEEVLKQSYADIRLLTSHLQEVREEERTNMAREIHDELGQQLTGIKMDIFWLNNESNFDAGEKTRIKAILDLLDETINTVRKISADLRPTLLDDLGLEEALRLHSREFQKRYAIMVDFYADLGEKKLLPKAAIGLFRIFQESLTNVARHSQAKNVFGCLTYVENEILLKIEDDGVGFAPAAIAGKKTLGLLGMKERVLMMDGKYEICSAPGEGTQITITIPLKSVLLPPDKVTYD